MPDVLKEMGLILELTGCLFETQLEKLTLGFKNLGLQILVTEFPQLLNI
jgi:hypothetical protein